MITGQNMHEQWATNNPHAKQWDDVGPVAKSFYGALAQAIEIEQRSIVAVKCPMCEEMVSAYGYNEHRCA